VTRIYDFVTDGTEKCAERCAWAALRLEAAAIGLAESRLLHGKLRDEDRHDAFFRATAGFDSIGARSEAVRRDFGRRVADLIDQSARWKRYTYSGARP
jgi:hypothetical protein